MIDTVIAQKHTHETLIGFPPEVRAAYVGFAETGAQKSLDTVVLGVLQFYLAKKPEEALERLPGTTRLVEDLGCDSLTMMDMVFMAESLFSIDIQDNELERIATIDDLRNKLRGLVIGDASQAA